MAGRLAQWMTLKLHNGRQFEGTVQHVYRLTEAERSERRPVTSPE